MPPLLTTGAGVLGVMVATLQSVQAKNEAQRAQRGQRAAIHVLKLHGHLRVGQTDDDKNDSEFMGSR